MPAVKETVKQVGDIGVEKYKFGWSTDLETEKAPIGLSEDTIRFISHKKDEPEWMLEWRLEAYQRFQTMKQPNWAKVDYPDINFNDMYFYSAPKDIDGPASLEDVDPELLKTYDKLGIPLLEQEMLAGVKKNIAVDVKEIANKKLSGEVVTNISLIKNYCPAEEYHQRYLEKR